VVRALENKYEELINNALMELRNRTDISQLVPGAKARSLLEIVMRETGNAYTSFSQELLGAFVRYARGDNLDMIAELFGVSRKEATRNEVSSLSKVQKFYVTNGTFGSINNGNSFTIPAGVKVRNRSGDLQQIEYTLTEAVTCNAADTEAYGSIRSVEFGPATNVGAGVLVEHDFSLYADYLNESLKTINIEGIAYATERETDDAFRFRIINTTLASEQANYVAIRTAALSVPGVADVVLDEFSRGIGTGAVYIKAVTPTVSEFLLAAVQDAIDRAKAFGNFVEARAPKPVGIELEVTLNLLKEMTTQEKADLKNNVRDAIYNYINGLDINESLDVALLQRQILGVHPNIKSIGTPTRPIDYLYVWKYSAAEDNRVRREALNGYTASNFERIVVEFTELPDGEDPIRVKV